MAICNQSKRKVNKNKVQAAQKISLYLDNQISHRTTGNTSLSSHTVLRIRKQKSSILETKSIHLHNLNHQCTQTKTFWTFRIKALIKIRESSKIKAPSARTINCKRFSCLPMRTHPSIWIFRIMVARLCNRAIFFHSM